MQSGKVLALVICVAAITTLGGYLTGMLKHTPPKAPPEETAVPVPGDILEDQSIRKYHTSTRNKEYARKWVSVYCTEDDGLCRVEDFGSSESAYRYGTWLAFQKEIAEAMGDD